MVRWAASRPLTHSQPSGPIEHTSCAYETIEQVNTELFPKIHELVEHPFFRYYKVDLFRECPFWQENGFCMNRACSVEETEEVGHACGRR